MVSLILLTPPAAVACISLNIIIYPKSPYDNAAIPVNRIDAFRRGDYGLRNDYALEVQMGKRSLSFNRVLSAGVDKFAAFDVQQ
jgi:hypothetical protein